MAILRPLLAGETVSFEGDHYRVDELRLPQPVQHAPILIGGNSPELLAVAAAYGDVATLAGSPTSSIPGESDYARGAVERQVRTIQELSARRAEEVGRHVLVQWHDVTDDRGAAAERAAAALDVSPEVALDSPYALIGTVEEIATSIRSWHATLGIARFTVFADRPDLQPADALAPVIELLGTSTT